MRGLWGGTEPVAPVKARLKTAKNGENRTNFERLIGSYIVLRWWATND